MRTKATIAGHPIHPALVAIPLGALPTALVLDILRVAVGDPVWERAALVATWVGVVGIAVAAIPGMIDYSVNVPRASPARRVATMHLASGFALLILFAGLGLARLLAPAGSDGAALAFLAVNAVGNVGLAAQGWLGGELRSRHRIGVDEARAAPRAAAAADEDLGSRVT